MSLTSLAEFFGWCTVVNAALLILTCLVVSFARNRIMAIHAKMFGMNESELPSAYLQYLANYKITILVLNLVPYVALKMMSHLRDAVSTATVGQDLQAAAPQSFATYPRRR